MTEKTHPTEPLGSFKNNRELGNAVAHMRYDQIVEFFIGFAEGTDKQARADRGRKPPRKKLADALTFAARPLNDLAKHFEEIANLCSPELRDEIAKKPYPDTVSIVPYVKPWERLLRWCSKATERRYASQTHTRRQ